MVLRLTVNRAELTDMVPKARFYIARFVKALFVQLLDPLLGGRSHDRRQTHIPLRCDFIVRWQTRYVDKALGFADHSLVERRDPVG